MTARAGEKIETLNVTGAGGVRIDKSVYNAVKKAILAAVPRTGEGLLFKDLPREVAARVPASMFAKRGSASWYATTVKLDLEARGLIERVPGSRPQRLRRVKSGGGRIG